MEVGTAIMGRSCVLSTLCSRQHHIKFAGPTRHVQPLFVGPHRHVCNGPLVGGMAWSIHLNIEIYNDLYTHCIILYHIVSS